MGVRLRTKFAIVIVVITLVLSVSVYAALESYKRDVIEEERASINQTAEVVAGQIDESIDRRRDDVGLVASRPRARQFDRSDRFLDAFLANSRFYAAQIVAANGTVVEFRGDITSEQRRAVVGTNRSNTDYVREALRGRTYVSDVEYAERADKPILVFSAPIFQDAEVKGALVASMYLDRQTVFGMLPPLETKSQAVQIVGNGMVLNENNSTFEAAVRSSSTVESTGWRVTVARDRSALDARLRRLAASQALALGLVLVAMIGFGYWQYAVSLRQTERLLEGFDQLGDGNYEYSVSLSGGAEWEQMSDGFDELAATLGAREAALRERQQRLEVLYRVLQHNLRNRMSVILNYADVIEDTAANETVADAARTILDTGRDVTSLSQKARQIRNAIEADPDRKPIEVTALVSEVAADLREEYPHVDVTTSLPDAAWVVALPSLRLAVENVSENACEHNDSPEPDVEIAVTSLERADGTPEPDGGDTVDADGGRVRITVADNGPGIPAQDRAAISEGRETALEHGSGLGLWLAYWIVDYSGGELRFADNEPRGSVVYVDLPRGTPVDRAELSEATRAE